ncbi:S8 family serine peptidase [Corynebacterium hindlerae]|uniref:S8 family serine peptidase n=1 Tax=Corynebacterium hindlerae TaxID=699041 RepID=A0A7G5FHV4_9CORY|nr:S8 family serine peptidase [Corynebacterium hindlerae]QMV86195.1 S8 family serine peptidase [Corynebacterium hindlerae]
MKKTAILATAVVYSTFISPSHAQAQAGSTQMIVRTSDLDGTVSSLIETTCSEVSTLDLGLSMSVLDCELKPGMSDAELDLHLSNDSNVRWHERDEEAMVVEKQYATRTFYLGHQQSAAAQTPNLHWNIESFGFPEAWKQSKGAGVSIAILDSGITAHPALNSAAAPGVDVIAKPANSRDGDGRDNDPTDPGNWAEVGQCGNDEFIPSTFHGTMVAGAIADSGSNPFGVMGAAPEARIVPVRVAGPCGAAVSDIISGILWSAGYDVEGVVTRDTPVEIINISYALRKECSPGLQEAIDAARQKGVSVITSAGNYGEDAALYSPGNCQGVINVGATNLELRQAKTSNGGETVAIYGPGGDYADDVAVATTEGQREPEQFSYRYRGGTSIAAPHVAGALALLKSLYPATPNEVLEQALLKSATAIADTKVLNVGNAFTILSDLESPS